MSNATRTMSTEIPAGLLKGTLAEYAQKVRSIPAPEMPTSKETRLFQRLVKEDGRSNNLIELYNHWIDNILPKQIAAKSLKTNAGTISFSEVSVEKPKTYINNTQVDLMPQMARARTSTYSGEVYATATLTLNPVAQTTFGSNLLTRANPQASVERKVLIGQIPIMLGCKYCHTWGKTVEEKIAMGECPNDPFGYFIIKGGEKSIIIQEKLRESMIFTFCCDKDGRVETRTTIATITGTTIVTMVTGKRWPTVKVRLHHMKGKHLPLFVIYEFLGYTVAQAQEMILRYIPPKNRRVVAIALQASIAKYRSIPDRTAYIRKKRLLNADEKKLTREQETIRFRDDIFRDLFTNLPTTEAKVDQLSRMTAQHLEGTHSLRPLDDRDNWGNKRLVTAAGSCEQLFNGLWDKVINSAQEQLDAGNVKNVVTAAAARVVIQHATLTDDFETAFGSNMWGVRGSWSKENITESLKRETLLSVVSQAARVNTPASRKVKAAAVRMIHGSQLGYICVYETPEGENVSLVKNEGVTTYVSLSRDLSSFGAVLADAQVKPYYGGDQTDIHPLPLIVNGIRYAWCNPQLAEVLKVYRRAGRLPKDVCIFHNTVANIVEYYCDGSRPLRPLFLVVDGRLVIDAKNLWDAPTATLINEGALEYVDAREQEYIMLAKGPDYVRRRFIENEQATVTYDLLRTYPDAKSLEEAKLTAAQAPFRTRILESKASWPQQLTTTKELLDRLPFTHSEIDPVAIVGMAGSLIPGSNTIQGPRNTYQASMYKQALGMYHYNHNLRWDSTFKVLLNPTRPTCETITSLPSGLTGMPASETPVVAIMALRENNEDGIVVKKEWLANGNLELIKYVVHKSIEQNNREIVEYFGRPEAKRGEPDGRYAAIDEHGIPRLGAYIRQGDCIVGKLRSVPHLPPTGGGTTGCFPSKGKIPVNAPRRIENASLYAGIGEQGYVDAVYISWNVKRQRVVRVKIRQRRQQKPGDKVASRYAQKGTFSQALPAAKLPRIVGGPNDGVVPDIFINPHSFPSRMTMMLLKEMIIAKACLFTNERVDATVFHDLDMAYFQRILEENGCDPNGWETMARPNGKLIQNKIFVALVAYLALRHHVDDKFSVRSRGTIKPISHQPVGGRQNEGG